ncbi:hypothetical protein [Streptomyces sp. NPDC001970]
MIFTPVAESRLRGTTLPRSFMAAAGLSVPGVGPDRMRSGPTRLPCAE